MHEQQDMKLKIKEDISTKTCAKIHKLNIRIEYINKYRASA